MSDEKLIELLRAMSMKYARAEHAHFGSEEMMIAHEEKGNEIARELIAELKGEVWRSIENAINSLKNAQSSPDKTEPPQIDWRDTTWKDNG